MTKPDFCKKESNMAYSDCVAVCIDAVNVLQTIVLQKFLTNHKEVSMEIGLLSINERLAKYKLFLDVALTDEVVKPLLANYGYDEPTMLAGKALYDTTFTLNQQQEKEVGEKSGATDELDAVRREAFAAYMELVGLTRIVLKRDRNLLSQLDLGGSRESSYDKSYMQMLNFYDAALGSQEIQDKLARVKVTTERLNAGKALVETMQQKHQSQLKETSEAQRATYDRDQALADLDDWMGDFRGVLRIALGSQPQYLERLGLVDPS